MDGASVSSLDSRFERFVDLSAVDTASVSSRALLWCPSEETRPTFPHKVGQSRDGWGIETQGEMERRKEDCKGFTKKSGVSSEQRAEEK
jgi:hypothetical protein